MALPPSTSTADIGFRPPQFSDDLDWLPGWLQPHVVAMPLSENGIADSPKPLNLSAQELSTFKENNCKAVDVKDLLLTKEKGRNSFHLHLSGEDDTPLSLTTPNEKVLRFRLHLSADGSSSSAFHSPIDISQIKGPNSSECVHTQVHEQPFHFHCETNKAEDIHGCLKSSSGTCSSKKLSGHQYCSSAKKDAEKVSPPIVHSTVDAAQDAEKVSSLLPHSTVDAEVSNAVEFSVSASEALVIHEMIHNEPYSKGLSTTAILDLALQVKQARLECSASHSTVTEEEAEKTDTLSDLDDSDMEDAYEDVGVFVPGLANIDFKNESTSRVQDTPISQQLQINDREIGHGTLEGQAYQVHPTLGQQAGRSRVACTPSGNLSRDIVHTESQTLHTNNQDLKSVSGMVVHTGTMIDHRHVHNLDDSLTPQGNYALGGSQGRRETNMAGHQILETSFFSESGGTAPDAHSIAHNYDASKRSPSYIQIGALCKTNSISQTSSVNTTKDSGLLGVDPLCSVVPCSLAADIYASPPVHDNDKRGAESDKGTSPEVNNEAKDMQTLSSLNIEVVCRESEENTIANARSQIIRRKTTSLRTYSVFLSGQQAWFDGKRFSHVLPKQKEDNKRLTCDQSNFPVNSITEKDLVKSDLICKGREEQRGVSVVRYASSKEIKVVNQHHRMAEIDGVERKSILENHQTPPSVDVRTEKNKKMLVSDVDCDQVPESPLSQRGRPTNPFVPTRKRVRLNEFDFNNKKKKIQELPLAGKGNLPNKEKKRHQSGKHQCIGSLEAKERLTECHIKDQNRHQSGKQQCIGSLEVKERLTKCHIKDQKRLIFRGLEFLLTGFSVKKTRELERILWKNGGVVLSNTPSLPNRRRNARSKALQLPVVLCTEKLQTTEFLYGCAANAFLLHVDWMTDSIGYGSVLPPDMYLILPNHPTGRATRIEKSVCQTNNDRIFYEVGIMLHGESSFCSKFAEVIKHGHGRVYKTLHWLVQSLKNRTVLFGVIVAENETYATRHLRKCASEHKIAMTSSAWIVNSLYNGKLLPIEENKPPFNSVFEMQEVSDSQQWTQEI